MKNKKKKLLKIYSILFLLLLVLGILLISVVKYFFIFKDVKENYSIIESKKTKEIEKQNNFKKNQIENKILNNYLLQKPGEKIIQIID